MYELLQRSGVLRVESDEVLDEKDRHDVVATLFEDRNARVRLAFQLEQIERICNIVLETPCDRFRTRFIASSSSRLSMSSMKTFWMGTIASRPTLLFMSIAL